MKFYTFLALLCVAASASALKPHEQLYGLLLGSQNASPAYQDLAREALQAHGIANPHKVPVRKMNNLVQKVFGPLYSFTAYGIWVNEELLDKVTDSEKTV